MSEVLNSSINSEAFKMQAAVQPVQPVSASTRMILGMIAVLFASAITYCALWQQYPWFKVSSEFDIGMGASNDARMQLVQQMQMAATRNSCAAFALGGSLLGAALSLVAPGCCSLWMRIISGWYAGAFWGGLVGYFGSMAYLVFVPRGVLPSLTGLVGAHALTYGLLGLGLGSLFGGYSRSAQNIVSRLLGGLIGGAVGGLLFAILVGFVGETQKGTEIIPNGALAQALWVMLPSLAIGWGILHERKPPPALLS